MAGSPPLDPPAPSASAERAEQTSGGLIGAWTADAGLRSDTVTAALTTLAEGAIALGALAERVAVGWLLLTHALVIGALVYWLRRGLADGMETSRRLLLLLATIVSGVIGALGTLLVIPWVKGRPARSPLLDAWYERIALSTAVDGSTQLAERVVTGRTLDADAPPPASLHAVMLRGSLLERQKALGLIARNFDPAYGPALQAALKSPEPVVRVQAAAVAARVRGALKSETRVLLAGLAAAVADPQRALAAAAKLQGFAQSGLLDAGDRVRAEAAVVRLREAATAHAAEGRLNGLGINGDTVAEVQEGERAMLAAGRARDLRLARRFSALLRRGAWRIRRRPARRSAHSAAHAGAKSALSSTASTTAREANQP